MSLTVGEVAIGVVGSGESTSLALIGQSVNFGARLLRAIPPGGIAASVEVMAALGTEAPALARRFHVVAPAFEVPGAGGLTVVVYAADDSARIEV
jgi:class 3 adenylate cyclase